MTRRRPRLLLTNDDGISAPGIRALAHVLHALTYDLTVVAPQHESSGISAALTAVTVEGKVAFKRLELEGLADVPTFSVAASPGYIAVLAGLGVFGPRPDVVLSGINRGANAGHAVLHSGTVGAALTAANSGARAMAVSLDVLSLAGGSAESGGAALQAADAEDDERNWGTAAVFARKLVPSLLHLPPGTVLNINAPDVPEEKVRGLRQATLAPFGQTQIAIAETGEGYLRTAVKEDSVYHAPGTDLTLLGQGYVVVTPIRAVSEARVHLHL
jgi:5'-nucleotidase